MLYRMANSGVMPRYVEGLGLTLHHHLGVPQDAISWGKHREQHQAVSRMLLQGNVSVVVVLNSSSSSTKFIVTYEIHSIDK